MEWLLTIRWNGCSASVECADVDFLFDVAIEMEPEDGLIWVLSLGDESVMAFTDFGVDSLVDLIRSTAKCPADLSRERRPLRPSP